MRTLVRTSLLSSFALVASIVAGCGGSSVTPSVSAASPSQAFAGRTLDVLLSGSGTAWDSSTTVSFGDKVTVNKLTVASPTALVANISVADDAAQGPRDITVTQSGSDEPYMMAFAIASSVSVDVTGTTAQGSIVSLVINNKDLDHLFDDTSTGGSIFSAATFTNIAITGPTGAAVSIDNVTPFKINATMLIDVTAAAGPFNLKVASGPVGGTTDNFTYPNLFTIAARTPVALTNGTKVMIDKPSDSTLYSYTPGGAGHLVSFAGTADDMNAQGTLIVLDSSGSFKNVVTSGATATWIPDTADMVYVVAYDAGATGGYGIDIAVTDVALTAQAGEGNNTTNDTSAGAVVLMTPPVRVTGASLSDENDVDYYKVTVPAGKKIHALTIAGDADTDTSIQFFGTDGMTAIADPTDNDYQEDAISPALPGAGTYYIAIAAGSSFDSSANKYDLIVTLE